MNLQVIDAANVPDFARLKQQFHDTFGQWDYTPNPRPLFPVLSQPKANAKLAKESDRTSNYDIYSLFLAPAESSGYEMCLWRSQDCTDICLNCSGKGALSSVQAARVKKTRRLIETPHDFFWSLLCEMAKAEIKSFNNGKIPVMRLNGTSDLPWDYIAPDLFRHFSAWKFYDYTKSYARAWSQESNWDITLSYSGHNWANCKSVLDNRRARVAVVFDVPRGKPLPDTWRGYTVIDGDKDDLRFLDPRGFIIGLRYKVVTINGRRMSASSWGSPFIVKPE
jgi:hypothetical protein